MNHDELAAQIRKDLDSWKPKLDADGLWSPDGGLDWSCAVLLRRLRRLRGLTQRQLAAQAGIVQSHVSKAESGADLHFSMVTRLIEALECRLVLRVLPVKPFELR